MSDDWISSAKAEREKVLDMAATTAWRGGLRLMQKEWEAVAARNTMLLEALSSIAANSCCDGCQEAALVARHAILATKQEATS